MTTLISNHTEVAIGLLVEQYKESTNLQALLTALIAPLQDLEDTLGDLDAETIDTAEGVQLDGYGKIIGIARISGQSDADYRVALKTKVIENVSNGEPERLITLFKTLTGSAMVVLDDMLYAAVGLMGDVAIPTQTLIDNYYTRIKRATPAGVRVDYLGKFDTDEPFAFDGLTSARGFGSTTDAAMGGKLATIYIDKNHKFAFDGTNPTNGGFGTIQDPLAGGVMVGL